MGDGVLSPLFFRCGVLGGDFDESTNVPTSVKDSCNLSACFRGSAIEANVNRPESCSGVMDCTCCKAAALILSVELFIFDAAAPISEIFASVSKMSELSDVTLSLAETYIELALSRFVVAFSKDSLR